jgi:colicin import membrane protein
MAKQKQNLIKLDEFNIQQLPELQNKKQEVSEKISTFKYVEIKDNPSYEEAKKVRTGVRTIRTDLQKEQKAVDKKIKDFILSPVKEAYEEIISAVIDVENIQQEEVTRWEDIKEKERQEKLLLEQQRFEGIKKCILEFKSAWLETVDRLLYPGIDSFLPMLEDVVSKMDRTKFEEFEILFDDALFEIKAVFKRKADLLRANEEIRLERERLAEIQAEQNRVNAIKNKIDSWEKNWLYVINNLEFRNISVTKNEFETQTALDCQELQSEYAEKRNQIQELLSAKVSQLKEAEEQRIERENFLKEKAEFEEKMRLEEQKKKEAEELLAKSKENEESEVVVEQTENYHEEDVHKNKTTVNIDIDYEIGKSKSIQESMRMDAEMAVNSLPKVAEKEVTWDSIFQDFEESKIPYSLPSFLDYLKENYNVPTKK